MGRDIGILERNAKGTNKLSDTKEDISHRASEYDDIIRHAVNCKNYLWNRLVFISEISLIVKVLQSVLWLIFEVHNYN